MKRVLVAMAAAALMLLPISAKAVIINAGDVGLEGTTNINGIVNGNVVPGLGSSLYLQYTGTSNGGLTWNFDYTFTNITGGGLVSEASAFGLNTTPNVVSATSTGLFDTAVIGANLPSFGTIDFCATAGANCPGGSSNGLAPGDSASGEFSLTFSTSLASISLDSAFARYQGISGLGFNGDSGIGVNNNPCVGCNPLAVPGPIVGAGLPGLVVACLGLMGLARHRRKKQA